MCLTADLYPECVGEVPGGTPGGVPPGGDPGGGPGGRLGVFGFHQGFEFMFFTCLEHIYNRAQILYIK